MPRVADDDVNKECHTEGHQKVCVLPPGPKYWPKILDSQSKVHLIIGHLEGLKSAESQLPPLPYNLRFNRISK